MQMHDMICCTMVCYAETGLIFVAGIVGYNILVINLIDVNDNAPYIYTTRPAVVWEDEPAPQFVAQVFGRDPDTPKNGPPFKMRFPADSPYNTQLKATYSQSSHSF